MSRAAGGVLAGAGAGVWAARPRVRAGNAKAKAKKRRTGTTSQSSSRYHAVTASVFAERLGGEQRVREGGEADAGEVALVEALVALVVIEHQRGVNGADLGPVAVNHRLHVMPAGVGIVLAPTHAGG